MNKLTVFFMLILVYTLFSTMIYALDMEVAETLLNHNNQEYVSLGQIAFAEERYEEAIEHFFTYWRTQRDDYNALYYIALCYNQLNNPELAGRFLLEAKKRTITQFNKDNTERNFSNVFEHAAFQVYRDEVFEMIDKRNNERGYISYLDILSKIRYRTILPNDFDSEKEYTVFIYLHGFGGSPHNIFGTSEMFQQNDIIFVVPYAPYPFELSSQEFTSLSWGIFDYDEGEFDENHSGMMTRNHIVNLNQAIRNKYKVKSLFLGGFSQGGMNTLSIGLFHQDEFDGLICFGGALWLPEGTITVNGSIPVLLIHGENDLVVHFDRGVEAYERLKNKGYNVELFPFDGAHTMTRPIIQKAIDWMKGN